MVIEQGRQLVPDVFVDAEQKLTQSGSTFFSSEDAAERLGISVVDSCSLLADMEAASLTLRVCRDGWVVTWRYRGEERDAPTLDAYLNDMMKHLEVEYYLSYAAAAHMRGASHHGVMRQRVNVETDDISVLELRHADGPADLAVSFHQIDPLHGRPVTTVGTLCLPPARNGHTKFQRRIVRVGTVETVLLDMMESPERCGGVNHVATIALKMLTWRLLHPKLLADASDRYALQVVQRTGSMLQQIRGIQHRIDLRPLMRHVRSRGIRHSVGMHSGNDDSLSKADRWGVVHEQPLDPDT